MLAQIPRQFAQRKIWVNDLPTGFPVKGRGIPQLHTYRGPVVLQNATADFSQGGWFSADTTIDGILTDFNGWAVQTQTGLAHAIVWETVADLYSDGLTLTMSQLITVVTKHLIGSFKFSVTTDDRSLFADGLATGGAISANWVPLTTPVVSSIPAMQFSASLDGSVLVTSAAQDTAVYTVKFNVRLSGVTGIRLDVLTHPSLPFNGPGMSLINGNFVLTEFTAEAI